MQKVKISTPLGKEIAANMYLPAVSTEKLVILCPGNLYSKDHAHMVTLAERLVESGYAVVSFDPLGTWESDGDICDYTIAGYLSNLEVVLEHMLKEGKYTRVLLGGHSRGAAVSILYAAKDHRISEVIGIMPSSLGPYSKERLELWEKNGCEVIPIEIPGSTEKREFIVPFSCLRDRTDFKVVKASRELQVPLLVIRGEQDSVVTKEEVEDIFNNAGNSKNLIVIPEAQHEYWRNAEHMKLVNDIILQNLSS